MRFWWVNQNQTYKTELAGGFLWSPKRKADGARNQFYDNMQAVQPGDVIFSYYDTFISAVGLALSSAATSPKPEFGNVGANWANEGWLIPVEFKKLSNKFRPKNYIEQLRPFLPAKYSPLQASGDGLQAVYLAEIQADFAYALIALLGQTYDEVMSFLKDEAILADTSEETVELEIDQRTDIGPTTKLQLTKARRGQGLFKANVRLIEHQCRITTITEPAHLVASHIKPWKNSTDFEKLDGNNGLLLSPHVDHLFDKGYVTFTKDGNLRISSHLEPKLLTSWGLPQQLQCGVFTDGQKAYLKYHNESVYRA